MNVKGVVEGCATFIKDYFVDTGAKKAIIGISGGINSTVVASLCIKALGKENVLGVIMNNSEVYDITKADDIVDYLGIEYIKIPIHNSINSIKNILQFPDNIKVNNKCDNNIMSRIRMITLYGVADCLGSKYRVANTSNLTKNFIGNITRYGDTAGDFAPISELTSDEVKEIGKYFNIPENYIDTKINNKMDTIRINMEANINTYIRDYSDNIRTNNITGNDDIDDVMIDIISNYYIMNTYKLEESPHYIPLESDIYYTN